MTRYELLVLLHVTAAIIWIGAGFMVALLVFGAARSGDRVKEAEHHRDIGWLTPRLFIPASLATLVFGILLVADGPLTLGEVWVVIGLVGWAVSFFLGFLYFKPEGERIAALVEQHGLDYPEVGRRVHRLNVVDRVQVSILFVVVANMVAKPTGDDAGVLVAFAAIVVIATVAGVAALRGRTAAPQTP